MELVIFEDIEDVLRLAITAELPPFAGFAFRAYTARPKEFPNIFVVVTRVGGGRRDIVTDAPLVSVDVYARKGGAPHEGDAVNLANLVSAWMNALHRRGDVSGVVVYESETTAGPYRNPDPLAPEHARFTFTTALAVRGRVVTY